MEEVIYEVSTVMMAESVNTGLNPTPGRPDANGHRGSWGNIWE